MTIRDFFKQDFFKQDFFTKRGWLSDNTGFEWLIQFMLLFIFLTVMGIYSYADYQYETYKAPCSYFSHRITEDVPVRCIKYFSK